MSAPTWDYIVRIVREQAEEAETWRKFFARWRAAGGETTSE